MGATTTQFLVELFAGLAVAGIGALLGQVLGLFRRMRKVEHKLDRVIAMMTQHADDFSASHQRMNDGEWHHRRGTRV